MVADLGEDIDSVAVKIIKDDTYVDDGASGGKKVDVDRMVGKRDETGDYDGTISKIMARGGFKIKEFVVEGDLTQPDENLLGNGMFGYILNAKKGCR